MISYIISHHDVLYVEFLGPKDNSKKKASGGPKQAGLQPPTKNTRIILFGGLPASSPWTWSVTDVRDGGRCNNHGNTVSFHCFKSQNFKLSVSNPKSKYVVYLSILSQISNCQDLGRKNKH